MNNRTCSILSALFFASILLAACAGTASPTSAPVETLPPADPELPLAPDSARVDLTEPSFSNPTQVTNPLFPISQQHSALQLGTVEGLPFRAEVTLLPGTRVIEWNGRPIEVLESQYAAYLDGRIHEVALDWYAQADDGSVWYFGEDVFNYEDGVVADTDGTWITGKDGPAGMIMPGNPQVGDVYRPENIPGLVFEEVTVLSVGQTVDGGPRGPTAGSIVVSELHMEGQTEDKTFAPGYGEFTTGSGANLEAVAVSIPTDALAEAVPADLQTITGGSASLFEAVGSEDWNAASVTTAEMNSAWSSYQEGALPPMLEAQMSGALGELSAAVDAHDFERSRQTSLNVLQACLDLELRHRPQAEIDRARFDLWAAQVLVDAEANDAAGVTGDAATLTWIRDRFAHTLTSSEVEQLDALLADLQAAVVAADLTAAAAAASGLREMLQQVQG